MNFRLRKMWRWPSGFLKTDDGCYSELDRFGGVKVPDTRIVAKEFHSLDLTQIKNLLQSKIHEHPGRQKAIWSKLSRWSLRTQPWPSLLDDCSLPETILRFLHDNFTKNTCQIQSTDFLAPGLRSLDLSEFKTMPINEL